MRLYFAVALVALSSAVCLAEDENKKDTPTALAQRFVAAIAKDDIDSAQACWFSADQMKTFIKNPPPDVNVSHIKDEALDHLKKQWTQRDAEIAARLKALIDALKKKGLDTSKIQLQEAEPKGQATENGLTSIQQLEIVMAIGDVRIEYRLGGAGQYGDRWYCIELCGSGAKLIVNNKAESISCEQVK